MQKRRKNKTLSRPCVVFTPEVVTVSQKALKLFAQSLRQIDHQSPRVAFAEETMNRVKGKLDAMSRPISRKSLTTFDYNERLILAAAIELYTLDLYAFPSTSQRAKELQQCQQIVAHFAPPTPLEEKKRGRKCNITKH